MLTFGQNPTYQSEDKFDLDISDDKRALTLRFDDFKAAVEASKYPAPPVATRAFSLVLPIEGDGKNVEIEFIVSGTAVTSEGATASSVLSVNGQTAVADFPANSDESVVQRLKFMAETASECRISVLLQVGRDSKNAGTAAFLNAMTIDAEILPRIA